jgi:hypothetical protein
VESLDCKKIHRNNRFLRKIIINKARQIRKNTLNKSTVDLFKLVVSRMTLFCFLFRKTNDDQVDS